MKIKAVIFDMDGILINSMKYHNISWRYAFNQLNVFPLKDEFFFIEGMAYREMINYISEKYNKKFSKKEKEKIHSIKREKFLKIAQLEIYPQVIPFIKYLKENSIKIALVSGSGREFVNEVLNKFFKDDFEIIITGDDVKNGKPNPEPYLKAVNKLSCDIENIIVIENAPLGIKSSKNAKIKTFAITTTLNKKYLRDANKIFFSHNDLIKYVKEVIEIK